MKLTPILSLILFLASCASSPPQDINNVCDMFEARRSWYKAAKRTEKRWGVPVYVTMAIIHQESKYRAKAKPPRKKFLWIFPGPRPSSAYGYAQALDSTWKDYRKKTGNWSAKRSNFGDAVDFIGWYNHNSYKRNGIKRDDAYSLYLAYHEGNGGFAKKTYRKKPWLIQVSKKVQANSARYKKQFATCKKKLGRSWLRRLLALGHL